VFIGIDEGTQASIFSIVNLAQTKVNKSLVYDLFSLAKERSPEKTCHEIAVALDTLDDSPFQGRIKRLGSATDGRFGETLSQATIVRGLLPYLTKNPALDRDIGKRFGFWDPEVKAGGKGQIFRPLFVQGEDAKILRILINYFRAVRDRWPKAWASTGRGYMLNRTNGYNALMRFLRPSYLYFTETHEVVGESDFASMFARTKLTDDEFSPLVFLPGTSGATSLYRRLLDETGVWESG
jgi:DGQHR domain-containing protein